MTYTSNNDPGEQPGLTLEALLKAKQELEAMLPELLYRTHKYAPLVNDKGAPAMSAIPEYDWANSGLVPRTTGRTIVLVHPDNLPHLQKVTKGQYRLVEWTPAQPQEPLP